VRYADPNSAASAVQTLNQSTLHGGIISVMFDRTSQDQTKLIVTNVPPTCTWEEMRDHFSVTGQVAFAGFKNTWAATNDWSGYGPSKGSSMGKMGNWSSPY